MGWDGYTTLISVTCLSNSNFRLEHGAYMDRERLGHGKGVVVFYLFGS